MFINIIFQEQPVNSWIAMKIFKKLGNVLSILNSKIKFSVTGHWIIYANFFFLVPFIQWHKKQTYITSFELCKFERITHSHLKDAHTYHVCPILLCGRAIFSFSAYICQHLRVWVDTIGWNHFWRWILIHIYNGCGVSTAGIQN